MVRKRAIINFADAKTPATELCGGRKGSVKLMEKIKMMNELTFLGWAAVEYLGWVYLSQLTAESSGSIVQRQHKRRESCVVHSRIQS